MGDYRAQTQKITAPTTIPCDVLLGAHCHTGTLTIDHGGAADATKRIVTLAAGEKWTPSFPVLARDPVGTPQQRSRVHCAGADSTILFAV